MKRQTKMAMLALGLAAMTTFAQTAKKSGEGKIPQVVLNSFKKEFPNAKKVEWENEKGNYEANFDMGKSEISALYNAKGEKLETETEISSAQLPASVKTYVMQNKIGKIKEAAKIQKADGTVQYEAEISGKDYIFDQNGKFMKSQKE
ncbi:MAG: PepSY-like domain-containing protein [Weeksellaceae bacterium]|nr:PepSY-like domain-containing protein [Bacteroidota bacterium]MCG2781420.1 PepSY-like domain-containing protein [Weeksellaceae bacterium]